MRTVAGFFFSRPVSFEPSMNIDLDLKLFLNQGDNLSWKANGILLLAVKTAIFSLAVSRWED